MKSKKNQEKLSLLILGVFLISIGVFSGCKNENRNTETQGETVTVIDDAGRTVIINMPVESFAYHGHNSYVYETLRAINAGDKIIGVSDRFVTKGKSRYCEAYFPELIGFKNVGLLKTPDYEVINILRPDVVISDEESYYDKDKTPGIHVIAIDVRQTTFKDNTMKFGYLFGKEKEAKKYIDWYNKWENEIKTRIKGLADDEKPFVYIGYYDAVKYGSTTFQVPSKYNYRSAMVHMAGGRTLGDKLKGIDIGKMDAEWIITKNPDVIIFSASTKYVGYDVNDPSEVQTLIEGFLSRSEFSEISAVKNNRVYVVSHAYILCGGDSGLIGSMYYAKWLYPDRFADIDPQEMHQEFVTTFQHLDLSIKGTICVYPTK